MTGEKNVINNFNGIPDGLTATIGLNSPIVYFLSSHSADTYIFSVFNKNNNNNRNK